MYGTSTNRFRAIRIFSLLGSLEELLISKRSRASSRSFSPFQAHFHSFPLPRTSQNFAKSIHEKVYNLSRTSTSISRKHYSFLSYLKEMDSKHLASGSSFPTLVEGKLRFYNMRFCPYAQRSLLVAFAKDIPLDIINVHLKEKPEWLLERNPGGKVPTIETSQGSLYESLLVSDYLDEVYPGRAMYPKDPFNRTRDRIWIDNISKVTRPFYKVLFNSTDPEIVKKGINDLAEATEEFDKELQRRGTLYFAGNEAPGMIDYMLWPFAERFPVFKILMPDVYDFDGAKEKIPTFEKWRHAMKTDPAVKATFIAPEPHVLFIKSLLSGTPDYDLLCK